MALSVLPLGPMSRCRRLTNFSCALWAAQARRHTAVLRLWRRRGAPGGQATARKRPWWWWRAHGAPWVATCLVADDAADLDDVALHVVLQDLQRLGRRHAARQQLDQVPACACMCVRARLGARNGAVAHCCTPPAQPGPRSRGPAWAWLGARVRGQRTGEARCSPSPGLDDDVRVPGLARGAHRHAALHQVELARQAHLLERARHGRPHLAKVLFCTARARPPPPRPPRCWLPPEVGDAAAQRVDAPWLRLPVPLACLLPGGVPHHCGAHLCTLERAWRRSSPPAGRPGCRPC